MIQTMVWTTMDTQDTREGERPLRIRRAVITTVQPPARRTRRNRETEVIDAGIQVFWRRGYSGASIQEIADAVGVLKGSLYHYIGSKEELLARIFQEAYEESLGVMSEISAMDAPPLDRLHEYLRRYIKQFLVYPERTQLYFRDWRYLTGPYLERVKEQRRTYGYFVRALIAEARETGAISKDVDPKAATAFILGGIHYIAEWYRRDGKESVDTIAEVHSAYAMAALRGYRA
jgi:TetR/AcrR family transcriptional regulator, cholesterol catabolism regulator